MSQYSLSVLCHFVTLADCIRSGYVGGQFVITRNILSFTFLYPNYIGSPSEFKFPHLMGRHDLYGETYVVWNYLLLYITSPSYMIVEFSRMLAFRFVTIRLRLASPSMFIT